MNFEDRVTKEYVEGLLGGGLKIAFGTYTGTGTTGADITFPFVPKFIALSDHTFFGAAVVHEGSSGWNTLGHLNGTYAVGRHLQYTLDGCHFTLSRYSDNTYDYSFGNGTVYYLIIG